MFKIWKGYWLIVRFFNIIVVVIVAVLIQLSDKFDDYQSTKIKSLHSPPHAFRLHPRHANLLTVWSSALSSYLRVEDPPLHPATDKWR